MTHVGAYDRVTKVCTVNKFHNYTVNKCCVEVSVICNCVRYGEDNHQYTVYSYMKAAFTHINYRVITNFPSYIYV